MNLKYLIPFVLFLMLFFACKKNENTRVDYNNGIEGSQGFVVAQQMTVQLLNTYFKSSTDSLLINTGESEIDGATVIYYTEPVEKIYIKYPYWGANDGYGHWRTNAYEAIPRTSFADPNAEIDVVFNDFFYDKDTITVLSMLIKQLGKADGVNDHYEISADRIYRDYRDTTGVLSYSFNQLFIRYKDPGTIYTSPADRFLISGTMNGVTKGILSFTGNIATDSAYESDFSCNWLKAGPATVITERFNYLSYVYFPEPDSCLDQYLIIINDNPFPYPID